MFEGTSLRNPSWVGLVVVAGLFYLMGQYIASQPQRIQQESAAQREINVQGKGEVIAKPDVARLSLGVQIDTPPSAKHALELLTQKFSAVVQALKTAGIKEADIKTTNVAVNPVYDFQGTQTLKGFGASETVEVTIRDLDKVGDVLAQATAQGVNQAGGVSFEVDDPTALQEEVQSKAIQDAEQKAKRLSKLLGVSLGPVKAFKVDEAPTLPGPVPMRAGAAEGVGGPPVPAGTQSITTTVTVTYELR